MLDNNFVSRLKMPENNFCLLRVNIHDKYREKHVWSKCGRKHRVLTNRPQSKILSHSSLRHICGRVVEFFRKLKFRVAYLRCTLANNIPQSAKRPIGGCCVHLL